MRNGVGARASPLSDEADSAVSGVTPASRAITRGKIAIPAGLSSAPSVRRHRTRAWLEEFGMLDGFRRQSLARDKHGLADRRHLKELRRERKRQTDAAMRGRVARHHAGVQCGP